MIIIFTIILIFRINGINNYSGITFLNNVEVTSTADPPKGSQASFSPPHTAESVLAKMVRVKVITLNLQVSALSNLK